MFNAIVLYGHPADPDAFEKYYVETHLPIAAKMKGVEKAEFTKFIPAPDGSKPAYYRMAELYFNGRQKCKKRWVRPKDWRHPLIFQILQLAGSRS